MDAPLLLRALPLLVLLAILLLGGGGFPSSSVHALTVYTRRRSSPADQQVVVVDGEGRPLVFVPERMSRWSVPKQTPQPQQWVSKTTASLCYLAPVWPGAMLSSPSLSSSAYNTPALHSIVLNGTDTLFRLRVKRTRPKASMHRSTTLRSRVLYHAERIQSVIDAMRQGDSTYDPAELFPDNVDPEDAYQQAQQCLQHFATTFTPSSTTISTTSHIPVLLYFDIPKRISRFSVWGRQQDYRLEFILGPNLSAYGQSAQRSRWFQRFGRWMKRKLSVRITQLAVTDKTRDKSGEFTVPIQIAHKWSLKSRSAVM